MVRRSNRRYCPAPPQDVVEVLPASAYVPPPSDPVNSSFISSSQELSTLSPPSTPATPERVLASDPSMLPLSAPEVLMSPASPLPPPTPELLELSVHNMALSDVSPISSDVSADSDTDEDLPPLLIVTDPETDDDLPPPAIEESTNRQKKPAKDASTSRLVQLEEGFYYVERVVDHALDEPTGRMMYLVHWHGYDSELDYTWEYEDDLRLCYSKVKAYCNQQSPKLKTNLVARGGASRSTAAAGINYDNWVTCNVVITHLSYYLKLKTYSTSLQIISMDAFDERQMRVNLGQSALYIILVNSHFYAILYDGQARIGYVGDSSNEALKYGEDFQDLRSIMRCPLVPLEFIGSIGVDQCGAGAVSICLELIRLYNQDELTRNTI